ncbi:MAG: GPI inositol-deacylase [Bacteroidales bacterium]|nr:GPI inositol-deacylase [Bacteroidales bacterium]
MAKVIIGIHGLGNKPSKETLQNWWKESMQEGLKNSGQNVELPKFELIYWADILHEKPLDETITDEKHPLYLNEKYVLGKEISKNVNHDLRKKILDWYDETADKIFLNEDMTINYSFIPDTIIHGYFKDLEAYYLNNMITSDGIFILARDQIRNRVIDILQKYRNDDIFLIAHSMGSIIAFDILTFNLPKLKINTYTTIGSPLGIPFVRSKIALEQKVVLNDDYKLKTPPGVQKWYNLSDLEDVVAINYSLKDDFDENKSGVKAVDFIVNNNYEIENEKNPHKSFGYLRTPEFSNILLKFIQQKEKGIFPKIKEIFRLLKRRKE